MDAPINEPQTYVPNSGGAPAFLLIPQKLHTFKIHNNGKKQKPA
eukprot:CAMPEP_0203753176 /NCGR_PEP_ID=MMETSP0098-20131031/6986_1 /ASSEMBLY_ACC=CAM_ASM_000208 /TAXON_ID=96639 /ORGANISM=" , Strain NY0313808BC1" /LENGTH=43 /DNA_ID= /DNA_START= /DNA_END= /DNA_ORIENTATION=